MDLGLAYARVVVTGGASNIGRGIVHAFAAEGARIVINYSNSKAEAEATAEACRKAGAAEVLVVQGDVSRDEDCRKIVAAAAAWGRLDVLVNNAGTTLPCPVEHLPLSGFRRQLEVNLVGPLAVTQALLPTLRRGNGRVVGIPVIVLAFAAMALVMFALLRETRFGRFVYASGDNPLAARITGIPTRVLMVAQYILSGLIAYSPVKRNSACQGPSPWTTSQ